MPPHRMRTGSGSDGTSWRVLPHVRVLRHGLRSDAAVPRRNPIRDACRAMLSDLPSVRPYDLPVNDLHARVRSDHDAGSVLPCLCSFRSLRGNQVRQAPLSFRDVPRERAGEVLPDL